MAARSDVVAVAGFGCVPRTFASRARFAGTYDREWLDRRWPLLPTDFDDQFFQCAPWDQQANLVGGEDVTIRSLTEDGMWKFRLPTLHLPTSVLSDRGVESIRPRLDTVAIDCEERRLRMTSRVALRTNRRGPVLREIVIGQMSPTWVRATIKRKKYLDFGRTRGAERSARYFEP